MSSSASNADAFYTEVATSKRVWTIKDKDGFPAPMNADKVRSAPFWSSEKRAQNVIDDAEAYAGFKTHEISLDDFIQKWIPGLKRDGRLVGLNWSGPFVKGFDLDPNVVAKALDFSIQKRTQE